MGVQLTEKKETYIIENMVPIRHSAWSQEPGARCPNPSSTTHKLCGLELLPALSILCLVSLSSSSGLALAFLPPSLGEVRMW